MTGRKICYARKKMSTWLKELLAVKPPPSPSNKLGISTGFFGIDKIKIPDTGSFKLT